MWQPQNALSLTDTVVSETPKETWPIVAGFASFGLTLAASTATQLHVLGVSTGTRPPFVPSCLGMASVCLASLVSHHAAIQTHCQIENYKRKRSLYAANKSILDHVPPNLIKSKRPALLLESTSSGSNSGSRRRQRTDQLNIGGLLQIPIHNVRICVVGLLAFKLLGGRFWAIAPSSYTHLGSFARRSIPATERYATPAQKRTLERIGRWSGCHTCGTRHPGGSGGFIGDHMPPKAVAQQWNNRWYNRLLRRKAQFRFYPQCTTCSNRQGGLVSKAILGNSPSSGTNLARAGGGKMAYFHGWRPRLNHASGSIVAATTVLGATNEQIRKGNSKRYHDLQNQAENLGHHLQQIIIGRVQAVGSRW